MCHTLYNYFITVQKKRLEISSHSSKFKHKSIQMNGWMNEQKQCNETEIDMMIKIVRQIVRCLRFWGRFFSFSFCHSNAIFLFVIVYVTNKSTLSFAAAQLQPSFFQIIWLKNQNKFERLIKSWCDSFIYPSCSFDMTSHFRINGCFESHHCIQFERFSPLDTLG